jgi:hypothetical protein
MTKLLLQTPKWKLSTRKIKSFTPSSEKKTVRAQLQTAAQPGFQIQNDSAMGQQVLHIEHGSLE